MQSSFSKTVQDNAERFLTNLVCFLGNTDRTLCCCEGLVSCQKQKQSVDSSRSIFPKVSVSKTYFTLISNGSRDTESLKAFSDRWQPRLLLLCILS